jgi:CheY-like chemotaxis protein
MAKKILLIEDEELMISVLDRKLTSEGYQVTIARNGEEGLELMPKVNPDIVLLDIIMPKKGGFDVLEVMAKDEVLKNIPVIIISNSGQPVELDRAKRLGASDWLIKTNFDSQEVFEKVFKQIGK